MQSKKQINKMPDWIKKQLELVDRKIRSWPPSKQKWAGVESEQQRKAEEWR